MNASAAAMSEAAAVALDMDVLTLWTALASRVFYTALARQVEIRQSKKAACVCHCSLKEPSHPDLFPTVAELAGARAALPPGVEGGSLAPILLNVGCG